MSCARGGAGGSDRDSLTCVAIALLLLAFCPSTVRAFDDEEAWSLRSSFRSLGGLLVAGESIPVPESTTAEAPPERGSAFGQQLGRIELSGQPVAAIAYDLHALSVLATRSGGQAGSGSLGGLPVSPQRYRALDLTWQPLDESQTSFAVGIDRLNIRVSAGPLDITLGRQPVSFGHTFFWNPTDAFLAFDPQQVDQDYKPGVDALRIDLALGDFSGLTLVAVAGEGLDMIGERVGEGRLQVSSYGSALMARAQTSLGNWALSLQGGAVHGGFQAGGGFTTDTWGLDLRGEIAAYLPRSKQRARREGFDASLVPRNLRGVFGVGYRFDNSLELRSEYFLQWLDGPADLALDLERFSRGLSLAPGRHTLGALASYEVTPLLRAQLFASLSIEDGSVQVQPLLVYSVSDDAELIAGAVAHLGRRGRGDALESWRPRSAYGSFPSGALFELKVYF